MIKGSVPCPLGELGPDAFTCEAVKPFETVTVMTDYINAILYNMCDICALGSFALQLLL